MASVHALAGKGDAVRSLFVVALMGGSYWLGVAARGEHTSEIYRMAAPAPMQQVLEIPAHECREIQKIRDRMEKIRGRG